MICSRCGSLILMDEGIDIPACPACGQRFSSSRQGANRSWVWLLIGAGVLLAIVIWFVRI